MLGANLGVVIVVIAAGALVLAGAYGVLGVVVRRRADAFDSYIRDAERQQARVSPAVPDEESHSVVLDEGMVEELFAELFSIRSTIGQLRSDVHALSAGIEPAESPDRGEDEPRPRVAA